MGDLRSFRSPSQKANPRNKEVVEGNQSIFIFLILFTENVCRSLLRLGGGGGVGGAPIYENIYKAKFCFCQIFNLKMALLTVQYNGAVRLLCTDQRTGPAMRNCQWQLFDTCLLVRCIFEPVQVSIHQSFVLLLYLPILLFCLQTFVGSQFLRTTAPSCGHPIPPHSTRREIQK